MKKISIVMSVYFNEDNLPDIIPRLLALEDKISDQILSLPIGAHLDTQMLNRSIFATGLK